MSEEVTNNAVDIVEETTVVEKSYKDICNELVANGAKRIKGLVVKSVKVTEQDTYVMISLTLDKQVEGYRADEETGIFEKGMTNIIFSSSYSLAAVIKNNEEIAFAANSLVDNPKGFEVALSGASIDIIQQPVAADEMYKNPFSTRDSDGVAFGHDTIINHIVNIVPSKVAMRRLDALALSLLGL